MSKPQFSNGSSAARRTVKISREFKFDFGSVFLVHLRFRIVLFRFRRSGFVLFDVLIIAKGVRELNRPGYPIFGSIFRLETRRFF